MYCVWREEVHLLLLVETKCIVLEVSKLSPLVLVVKVRGKVKRWAVKKIR